MTRRHNKPTALYHFTIPLYSVEDANAMRDYIRSTIGIIEASIAADDIKDDPDAVAYWSSYVELLRAALTELTDDLSSRGDNNEDEDFYADQRDPLHFESEAEAKAHLDSRDIHRTDHGWVRAEGDKGHGYTVLIEHTGRSRWELTYYKAFDITYPSE